MRRLMAALVILVAAMSFSAPAGAATTYTVTPGGAYSGSGSASFADTVSGYTVTCANSSESGTLPSGTVTDDIVVRTVSVSFSSCSDNLGRAVSVGPLCLPFLLHATGYGAGVTTVTNSEGCYKFAFSTCLFAISGVLDGTYSNATQTLALEGTLHTSASSACTGIETNGDPVHTVITHHFSPNQVITSP